MMLCVKGKVNYDLPLGPSNSSQGPDIHGRWTIYFVCNHSGFILSCKFKTPYRKDASSKLQTDPKAMLWFRKKLKIDPRYLKT